MDEPMSEDEFRSRAYIEDPETAMITDFLIHNKSELIWLYIEYCIDANDVPSSDDFYAFVRFIYAEGSEIDPLEGERIITVIPKDPNIHFNF